MSYDREREFFRQQADYAFTTLSRPTTDSVVQNIGSILHMPKVWPRLSSYRSVIVDLIKLAHSRTDPTTHLDEELYRSYLDTAYHQLTKGKGDQRHGNGSGMHVYKVMKTLGQLGLGFPLGQAVKKVLEADKRDAPVAVHELLGAVNYVAFAYLHEFHEKAA